MMILQRCCIMAKEKLKKNQGILIGFKSSVTNKFLNPGHLRSSDYDTDPASHSLQV